MTVTEPRPTPTDPNPTPPSEDPLNDAHAHTDIDHVLERTSRLIAPLWPLDRYVAVNPYLGLTDRSFASVTERLASAGGIRSTLPQSWYLEQVEAGRIRLDDIADAIAAHPGAPDREPEELVHRARADGDVGPAARTPTVADVGSAATGIDLVWLVTERVSSFAAARWDLGQAAWRSSADDGGTYDGWLFEARVDRTPEVLGVAAMRRFAAELPADPREAVTRCLHSLGIPPVGLERYLHRLLLRNAGWAGYLAQHRWEAELRGGTTDDVVDLLAIQLAWEVALLEVGDSRIRDAWEQARTALAADAPAPAAEIRSLILQEAFDLAEARHLGEALGTDSAAPATVDAAPRAQAVFCIDVRSEVLRRRLEAVAPDIETIGFAGFFGFPIEYRALGHEHGAAHCPVLLAPQHTVAEGADDRDRAEATARQRRNSHHLGEAWKSFKMGAISCFSFVGPVGLAYVPRLVRDAAGRPKAPRRTVGAAPAIEQAPDGTGIGLADRVGLAEGALRGMSLTDGFAPVVLLVGHASTTTNNPHAAGLHCGACGGRSGEASARIAASVLNDPAVRLGLADRGIRVPDETVFVPALHDTTTDEVRLLPTPGREPTADQLARLRSDLASAGEHARRERAPRLGIAPTADVDAALTHRGRDWAQVRPEWGLAGCRAFIAAPRHRTSGIDLGGRAFLHSYDWRTDVDFATLEVVMTAPMVVASWINLQYFASTVDPDRLGAGNKVLHDVVGQLGVLEGSGSDLRVGLPWQSVHDGERLQHEPVRLKVMIEAPTDAISAVLRKHDHVRDLCDNGWVHLFALDGSGRVGHRYVGDGEWAAARVGEPVPA